MSSQRAERFRAEPTKEAYACLGYQKKQKYLVHPTPPKRSIWSAPKKFTPIYSVGEWSTGAVENGVGLPGFRHERHREEVSEHPVQFVLRNARTLPTRTFE
jgi:hypothetical protein